MLSRRLLNVSYVWVLLSVLVSSALRAQEAATPAAAKSDVPSAATEGDDPSQPSSPRVEAVQTRIKALEEAEGLEEEVKTKVRDLYTKAIEFIDQAAKANARAEQFKKLAAEAPTRIEQLKAELAESPPELEKPSAKTSLAELQQSLTAAEADLAEARKQLTEIDAEIKRRPVRREEIAKANAAARQQLDELKGQLAAKPAPNGPEEVSAAARTLLKARTAALEAEIYANEQEALSYEPRGELLPLRRDQAARRVAQAERRVTMLTDLVNARRRAEVEQQAADTRRAAAHAHPALQAIAEKNAQLVEDRKELTESIERTAKELDALEKTRTSLEEDFKRIREQTDRVGFTEAIGLLLRRQRAGLPSLRDHRKALEERAARVNQVGQRLFEYQEARTALSPPDIEERAQRVLAGLDPGIEEAQRESIDAEVHRILESRRDYLGDLILDAERHLDQLVSLDTRQHEFIDAVEKYAAFIDEHILWIRSAESFGLANFAEAWEQLLDLGSLANLQELGSVLLADTISDPARTLLAVLVFAFLFLMGRRTRKKLRALGEVSARSRSSSMVPTAEACLLTVVIAAIWPAALWYVGWRVAAAAGGREFSLAIGIALQRTAGLFFGLEVFRQVCRSRGLGEAHFGWHRDSMKVLNRTLRGFIVTALPLVLIAIQANLREDDRIQSSLGRLAFVLALLLLAVAIRRVAMPSGTVLQRSVTLSQGGLLHRLRFAWYSLAVGLPLVLAGLAVVGYYYTAMRLASCLVTTGWLVVALVVANALLLRWLLVGYRKLAIKRAQQRRAAAQAEAPEAGAPPSGEAAPARGPEVKLSDINVQTRKLLRTAVGVVFLVGLWVIWADVVPALGILHRVELWPDTIATGDGVTEWITLADLALALVVALITLTASRNLPGLLEITVLHALPLTPGGRYALVTVTRYAITVVGIVIAFGLIGIGWSKVQWLAAAITVGLGFGLQEIFANFVSGLILLFERPIRVGDIVTVGEVTGKVSRMRMRATTITDWDLRELVVPNKEFITGRLVNWTLSDTLSRMTISVGIAYGSDTEKAYNLLLKVAHEHPLVLDNPPPHALFDGFGDSTLNFTLRVYMPSRDIYLKLRHELHVAVDNAFREAGIEIAFPQRDIHVRTIEPALSIHEDHRPPEGQAAGDGNGVQSRDEAARETASESEG